MKRNTICRPFFAVINILYLADIILMYKALGFKCISGCSERISTFIFTGSSFAILTILILSEWKKKRNWISFLTNMIISPGIYIAGTYCVEGIIYRIVIISTLATTVLMSTTFAAYSIGGKVKKQRSIKKSIQEAMLMTRIFFAGNFLVFYTMVSTSLCDKLGSG